VQRFRDDNDAALASYAQALGLFQAVGSRLGEANTLSSLGFLKLDHGEAEEGLKTLDAALALYQAVGDRVGMSNTLWGLGQRLAQTGQLSEAEPLMAEAVELSQVFAPGHPVTEWRAGVLAQVRAQLHGETPLPRPERRAELREMFGGLILAIAAVAHGDEGRRAEIEGLFDRLTAGNWHIVEAIRRIWTGERDEAALTAGLDADDSFLVREMLAALADPQGYAAGLAAASL